MRKIIVLSFVTMDGIIQAPGGPDEDTSGGFRHGGWTVPYFDAFANQTMGERMGRPFELLLGRKTFEIFASYWPAHAAEWPGINEAVKYVASNTRTSSEWRNSVFLSGNIAEQIDRIKQQEGPDLQVYGSGNLIQTLIKHDLIDEFWLMIFPLTLGTGKRLFDHGTMPQAFELTSLKSSPLGVIVADYRRAGEIRTGSF